MVLEPVQIKGLVDIVHSTVSETMGASRMLDTWAGKVLARLDGFRAMLVEMTKAYLGKKTVAVTTPCMLQRESNRRLKHLQRSSGGGWVG